MKEQKLYKYNKPSNGKDKSPLILCYANNEAHALQVLRERFKNEDGTYERIDKSLIEEYKNSVKDNNKSKSSKKKVVKKNK